MRFKKMALTMATALGCSIPALPAIAGCAGLVVGTYTATQYNNTGWGGYNYQTYLCISNANYDATSGGGFQNGGCPANSFPVQVSSGSVQGQVHCCFAAGTPIWLPDGRRVGIETIAAGDDICVYNLATNVLESAQVLSTIKKSRQLYRVVLNDGVEEFLMTDDHPLWDGEFWLAIDPENAARTYAEYQLPLAKLEQGSRLVTATGTCGIVTAIELIHPAAAADVYTLHVDHPAHNFLVGHVGAIAHNKCQ